MTNEQLITSLLATTTEELLQNVDGRLTLLSLAKVNRRACKEVSEAVNGVNRSVQRIAAGQMENYLKHEKIVFGLRRKINFFKQVSPSHITRMLNSYMIDAYRFLFFSSEIYQKAIPGVIRMSKGREAVAPHGDDKNSDSILADCFYIYLAMVATFVLLIGVRRYLPEARTSFTGRFEDSILAFAPEDMLDLIHQFYAYSPEGVYPSTVEGRVTVAEFERQLNEYITRNLLAARWRVESPDRAAYREGLNLFADRCQRMSDAIINNDNALRIANT